MMFRKVVFVALAATSALYLLRAATLLELEYRNARGSSADPVSRRILFDSTRLRIDSFGGSGETARLTIIFHSEPGVLLVVDHASEEYLRIDREAVEARVGQLQGLWRELKAELAQLSPEQREMAARGLAAQPSQASLPKIQPSPQTEEIGGYRCRKHQLIEGGQVTRELWIAPWSELGLDEASVEVFSELGAFVQELMTSFGENLTLGAALKDSALIGFCGLDGFPVMIRELRDGETASEDVLQRVANTTSHPGFEPPVGYRESEFHAPAVSEK